MTTWEFAYPNGTEPFIEISIHRSQLSDSDTPPPAMVQPGAGGLDTPQTNVGDATYLNTKNLDFDLSQEVSFQSPSKDSGNNLLQQLRNGRRGGAFDLKTPRSRAALGDRRNLGGEFTPLLKSATRNSALRIGKENVPQTPAFLRPGGLEKISEDYSPLPRMESSIYGRDRSYASSTGTPMPRVQTSSAASTPMALLPRRNEGPAVLQDGNQLSLREQENVIDKIEKENFGLKLKIHFLEEALRKAGPGFSEAALKENTDLKVDKVTMQKELHRYKKNLAAAEREVEVYRQKVTEFSERKSRKHFDAGQQEEMERLRRELEEKEAELRRLRNQEGQFDDFQDKIHDLETDLRKRDRELDDYEDQAEKLKDELAKKTTTISELEQSLKKAQRREIELEEKAEAGEELEDAKETITELERNVRSLKEELEGAKEEQQEALRTKARAESDLEELQDEMANKSITTKGLSRQIEEKAIRMQNNLEDLRAKYNTLEEECADKAREVKKLKDTIEDLKQNGDVRDQKLKDRLELVENDKQNAIRERNDLSAKLDAAQRDLLHRDDEKNLLQIRHDALTTESASLQREITKSQAVIADLSHKLDHEKTLALHNEREVRDQYIAELNNRKNDIEDLQADLRDKQRVLDQEIDKWDSERRNLQSQKEIAEKKASDLQQTIDKLQQAEGNLSTKEKKLQQALESEKERHANQEALLNRQINDLNDEVKSRREALEKVQTELRLAEEESRLAERDEKALNEKVEGLEDEVEVLQTSLDEETDRYNEEISAARQEADNLRRQLQTLEQDLVKAETAANDARVEKTQFFTAQQDKQGLDEQVASLNTELRTVRSAKAEVEAERDEIKSQLRAIKQQEDETFRMDQERLDLRAAKMKLDNEVRRLKEENKSAVAAQEDLEKELQEEIDRASLEEDRLNSEIQDLQRILRGSSEKKELAAAKKTIHQLESRIHELENQLASGSNHTEVTSELSIIRQDLLAMRSKETEYIQREAAQKDNLRSLKRQIAELERKAHDADISRLAIQSPQSSFLGSARKSELVEVRHQLSNAHATLKDLRFQIKHAEKESSRKLIAVENDLLAKSEAWEIEKDRLERTLDDALLKRDQLTAQNSASEATISRLRSKIDRLEQALQAERLNTGDDRTIAMERHDLHEMLRESQVQVETLEMIVREREQLIASTNAAFERITQNLSRVRSQREQEKSRAESATRLARDLESKFKEVTETLEFQYSQHNDFELEQLREERNMHRAKAEAAARRLTDLESQLAALRKVKSSPEKSSANSSRIRELEAQVVALQTIKSSSSTTSSNIERIRAEREELRAHVERAHVRIALLEADIKRALAGWEAEKQLSQVVDRLREERNNLLEAQQSQEQKLRQLEQQIKHSSKSATSKNATSHTFTEHSTVHSELAHVRDERDRLRSQVETTTQQLEDLEIEYQEATEVWDADKFTLTRGIVFPNMSIQVDEDEVQLMNQIDAMRGEWSEKEMVHIKASKNLQMQVDWWRKKYEREAGLREMARGAKMYMKLQIQTFEAW